MSKRAVLLTTVPMMAIALVAGCTSDSEPEPQPTTAVEGGAAAVDKPNTVASIGDKVTWERFVEPCKSGELVVVQDVAAGDLTGDGAADAAVARACEGVDEYGPSTVEVFDGASSVDQPKRVGTLLSDAGTDKPYVDSVAFTGGALVIKANGVDETSDAACPEVVFTYQYKFADGAFKQEKRETVPDETCGPE
ncbi:hypothetical protein AB0F81_22855 [Actinoplanes sp. NPDC024001]|uniref:hypothetical protein n=1 Tax=Actinoplanes sp. NPDC024001 TaxID=3154598 RepID=UPI0033D401E0